MMGSFEILSKFADGNVKVEIFVLMENPSNQMDEYAKGCILVSCELHLHCSKLDKPANIIMGWDFESD